MEFKEMTLGAKLDEVKTEINNLKNLMGIVDNLINDINNHLHMIEKELSTSTSNQKLNNLCTPISDYEKLLRSRI